MTTGEKLQKLRKDNNYTQEELADIMNVSRQSISKWESDMAFPETDKLIALSKLFHCTVDYLLNSDNDDANSLIIEEKENSSATKSELPFFITTLSAHALVLILFFCPWIKIILSANNYNYLNYYQIVFFQTIVNDGNRDQYLPHILALVAFVIIVATIVLSVLSLLDFFTKKRGLSVFIRLLNIIIPFIILSSLFFTNSEWLITGLFAAIIYAALIICQFIVKPLKLVK